MAPSQRPEYHYPLLEELLNGLTHAVGAILSVAGTLWLILLAIQTSDPWKIFAVSVFGTSLIVLYSASTLFHSLRSPRLRAIFKMLDHCAIYGLIAGTYTPFLLVNMRDSNGWVLFAIIWGLAGLGIMLKLFYGHRFKLLRVGIYLAMGWLIVISGSDFTAQMSATGFWLLLAGGLIYTAGVGFYLADSSIPYNHAIWHLFVLGGSACHFFAVMFAVIPY